MVLAKLASQMTSHPSHIAENLSSLEAVDCPETTGRTAGEAAAVRLRKVHLEITDECNLNCGMCFRRSWEERGGSMTVATFDRLLAQFLSIPSLSVVQFGGFGEPTVHPEFWDFLRQIKEAGLQAELITNGTTFEPDDLARLLDRGLDKLVVSLDGVDLSDADPFHPSSNGLAQKNLRLLYGMKSVRGLTRPEVAVEFVASRRNVHQLPEVKRLGQLLGFTSILVTNLVPHTREQEKDVLYAHWATAKHDELPSPWNPTINLPRLDPRSEASSVIEQLRISGANLNVCDAKFSSGGMQCRFVNEGCLAITSDGGVSPCLSLLHTHSYYYRQEKRSIRAHRLGNVTEQPLVEIWDSPEYRSFRERVRKFEFSPCIDCGTCELRETNDEDCYGSGFPSCGECLWAAGIVQCP